MASDYIIQGFGLFLLGLMFAVVLLAWLNLRHTKDYERAQRERTEVLEHLHPDARSYLHEKFRHDVEHQLHAYEEPRGGHLSVPLAYLAEQAAIRGQLELRPQY